MRVVANQQRKAVSLRIKGEMVVFSMLVYIVIVAKFNPQYVLSRLCHAVGVLVSKPELCVNIAEAVLVLFPRAIEVNRTILPTLEHLQSFLICQNCHWRVWGREGEGEGDGEGGGEFKLEEGQTYILT